MIVIVDYGLGNLGSILNMFKRIGAPAVVSAEPSAIAAADKLVLPGVGAFDAGMRQLNASGLIAPLTDKIIGARTPLIGLCLGMQLLTKGSEEGALAGLGWIDATTVRFHFDGERAALDVPHMGWNTVRMEKDAPLVHGLPGDARFYFVHSYHIVCERTEDVAATTHYGYDFPSIIQRGHIMATQFHPEKSHKFGMRLLQNFVELA